MKTNRAKIYNFPKPKAQGNKFWSFKAAGEDGIPELLLYGEISNLTWWGDEVTPKDFKRELDALGDVNEIKVFINSPGGDVFAGQAIYSMLKRHKAKVTAYIDGWAASIASVIAMAADVIIMPRNAMMMIHNPWTIAMGDAVAFRSIADDLDKARETLLVAYQEKTGMDKEAIIALLDAETLMTAEEAVEMGFADEIEDTKQIAASMDGRFLVLNNQKVDVNGFKNVPKFIFTGSAAPQLDPEHIPPEAEHPDTGVLSLYQLKTQVNKNRRF